jgi:hypothetical protein
MTGRMVGRATWLLIAASLAASACRNAVIDDDAFSHHAIVRGSVSTRSGQPAAGVELTVSYPAGDLQRGAGGLVKGDGTFEFVIERDDIAPQEFIDVRLFLVARTAPPRFAPPFLADSSQVVVRFGRAGAPAPVTEARVVVNLP